MKNETQLYHVCNDYTLEADDTIDTSGCTVRKAEKGILYFNGHGELVFFQGAEGLDGQEL